MKFGSKTRMIMPVISINGTDPELLMEQYQQAVEALDRCVATLGLARNARDYQSMKPDAQIMMLDQFSAIAKKLRDVRDYLDDHVESISDQIDRGAP